MPYRADLHIDQYLQDVAFGYAVPELICDAVAPPVYVPKESDYYRVYGTEFMSIPANGGQVADATPTHPVEYGLSKTQYVTKGYGFHQALPRARLANVDGGGDVLRRNAAFQTKRITELAREKAVATLLQATGTYTATAAALSVAVGATTAKWGNASTVSHPLKELASLKSAIVANSGQLPNVAWFAWDVWNVFCQHADVRDQIKYSAISATTTEIVARLLEVDEVVIGKAIYNSAAEGATASVAQVWTNTCGLLYRQPSMPGIDAEQAVPTSFRQFVWTAPELGAAGDGSIVNAWYEEKERAEYIEYMKHFVPQTTFGGSAGLLSAVLS